MCSQRIWVTPLHRIGLAALFLFYLKTGLDNHKKWNHRVGFAADRAHHIIIGILLPNLESDIKLSIWSKHSCL